MSIKDLQAHQAQNRERTTQKVKAAMATIEQELKEHGYYQEKNGRVTAKEVCRRAGIGHSTLKNPAHKKTLDMVRRWLDRLKKVAPTAKADADVIKREQTKALVGQIESIARHYNRFKIEYESLLERATELENRNAELEAEKGDLECQVSALKRRVAELERGPAQSSGTNVIPFPRPDGSPE